MDRTITSSEAARIIGISQPRVIQLANAGKIPHARTRTGIRLFKESDVIAFKAGRDAIRKMYRAPLGLR